MENQYGETWMIHLILLSTVQYKWLDGMSQEQYKAAISAAKK